MGKPLPLDNTVGRLALISLLEICEEAMGESYNEFTTINCGGGALNYKGSCTISRFNRNQSESEEEAMEFLAACKVPKKRSRKRPFETRVPDGQIFAILDNHQFDQFSLTAEVKSSDTGDNEALLQTWQQALTGLNRSSTTYGVLLKPGEGKILQLCVHDPKEGETYRSLNTKMKTWSFLGEHDMFDTENFINFMKAILDVMLKSYPDPGQAEKK